MSSTKKNPKLNVRLLRRIQKHILEEPKRLVMGTVSKTGKPGQRFTGDEGRRLTFPECGTVACIAGWAIILSGKQLKQCGNLPLATRLLRLSATQKYGLFLEGSWPRKFAQSYSNAATPLRRAKIAVNRIEHFIKTGE